MLPARTRLAKIGDGDDGGSGNEGASVIMVAVMRPRSRGTTAAASGASSGLLFARRLLMEVRMLRALRPLKD